MDQHWKTKRSKGRLWATELMENLVIAHKIEGQGGNLIPPKKRRPAMNGWKTMVSFEIKKARKPQGSYKPTGDRALLPLVSL